MLNEILILEKDLLECDRLIQTSIIIDDILFDRKTI